MLAFLYLLAAMGVGYAAKLDGRQPWIWFGLGVVLTPIGGSLLLTWLNRSSRT